MEDIKNSIKKIRQLLIANEMQEALDKLIVLAKEKGRNDILDRAIELKRQHRANEEERESGREAYGDVTRINNRISNGILQLLKDVGNPPPIPVVKNRPILIGVILLLVSSCYWFLSGEKTSQDNTFCLQDSDLTVYLKQKGDERDMYKSASAEVVARIVKCELKEDSLLLGFDLTVEDIVYDGLRLKFEKPFTDRYVLPLFIQQWDKDYEGSQPIFTPEQFSLSRLRFDVPLKNNAPL